MGMSLSVQGPSAGQVVDQAAPKDRHGLIVAELARDGILITKTGTTDRSDGPVHRLTRAGQPDVLFAFHDGVPTDRVVLRARLAMGVLPEAARSFAGALAPGEGEKLARLLVRGTVLPEELVYDRKSNRLYSLANELFREGNGLVVRFGEDRGDGPGELRITNVDGRLHVTARFEYYGSKANALELT